MTSATHPITIHSAQNYRSIAAPFVFHTKSRRKKALSSAENRVSMYEIPEIAIKPASAGFFTHILPSRELSDALFVAAYQDGCKERDEGGGKQRRDEHLCRPPATRAGRMPRREENFARPSTLGRPIHRQMAGDGKFAPAPVASRQHAVRRFLPDDARGQFPLTFPNNFSGGTRPARPQREAIARTLHLVGDAVTAHFGLNAATVRQRQPQDDAKQRRDEEDECPDTADNPFHRGVIGLVRGVAGGFACFFSWGGS